MNQQTVVKMHFQGPLAVIEINRPEALNALNAEVMSELKTCVQALQSRTDVHVVVLCGAGEKAFVAGADIKQMQSMTTVQATTFSTMGNAVFAAIENLPQIVIARVQGFALGGGLELALAADFIVASHKAKFGLPEVSLGLIPGFGGTQRLASRVGVAKAIEWMTTASKVSADEALRAGLVNTVVAPEELVAHTDSLVAAILKNGPLAVRTVKAVVRKGKGLPLVEGCALEAQAFGELFHSSDTHEGIQAFVDKRPPVFSK